MIDKAIIDELKGKGYITNPFVTGENLEVADLFKYGYITRVNNEELEGILGGIENVALVDEPAVDPVVDEPVVNPVVDDPAPVNEPDDEVVVDEGEEE